MKRNRLGKKTATFALALFVAMSSCSGHSAWADSSSHWADSSLKKLSESGVMRGYNGKLFPDRKITRAEFVSMVNRSFGFHEKGGKRFSDVKGTEWYAEDISIGNKQGYFAGSDNNQAQPTKALTREQALKMINGALKIEEIEGENLDMRDGRKFSNWARGAINASLKKGFASGFPDGTFRPQQPVTRAEIASILDKAAGTMIHTSGTHTLGQVQGNVTISAPDVNLVNTIVMGDLYVTEGLDLGALSLNGVKVLGEVIVSGGGEDQGGGRSLDIRNSVINKLIVDRYDKTKLTVKTDSQSTIGELLFKTSGYVETPADSLSGVNKIVLEGEKTNLDLAGNFSVVHIRGIDNRISVEKGKVQNFYIDEVSLKAKLQVQKNAMIEHLYLDSLSDVIGEGEIRHLSVNKDGSKVQQLPENIEIRPGVSATVGGKKMGNSEGEENSQEPFILSGYPKIQEQNAKGIKAIYQTNKEGILYWAITNVDKQEKPSRKDIIKANRETSEKLGSIKVSRSKNDIPVSISGLTEDTEYLLSAVMVDARNSESLIRTTYFSTSPKSEGGFVTGYPKISEVTSETLKLEAKPDLEVDEFYWAVYPKSVKQPTAKEVYHHDSREIKEQERYGVTKRGTSKGAAKNQLKTIEITGLDHKTAYNLYLIPSYDKKMGEMKVLPFTTLDLNEPKFVSGYPQVLKLTKERITVAVKGTEDAKYHWALFPKNAKQPTQKEVLEQKMAGDLKRGITGEAKINEQIEVMLDGLEEMKEYNLYLLPKSVKGREGKMVLLPIKTGDYTVPEFVKGYPKSDKVTNKAVEIVYNLNENATVYWVVVPRDEKFPKTDDVDEKDNIINGNHTLKSGKASASELKEGRINIGGLEAEKPYDVYMIGVDQNGNRSVTKKLQVKTLDNTAPTAELEFKEAVQGKPIAGTDIHIVFSEIVWEAQEEKEFSDVYSGKEGSKPVKEIFKNVKLYDMSKPKPRLIKHEDAIKENGEYFGLDYGKLQFKKEDNRTIVVLPAEYTKYLKSGITYRLGLEEIKDTSGNKMKRNTYLPFQTVAPIVNLYKTIPRGEVNTLSHGKAIPDMTFVVEPENADKSIDEIKYDMIFRFDKLLKFELFEREVDESLNPKSEWAASIKKEGKVKTNASEKDKSITYSYLKKYGEAGNLEFEEFNKKIKKIEYGIYISELEGSDYRNSWSGTVRMNIRNVVGTYNNLNAIATDPDSNLKAVLEEGASLVNQPEDFTLKASFADIVIPEFRPEYNHIQSLIDAQNFGELRKKDIYSGLNETTFEQTKNQNLGYPKFIAGDEKIEVRLRTDKESDFYYVIAPKGAISTTQPPKADMVVAGKYNLPVGGKTGKYHIPQGFIEVKTMITGLDPVTEYDIFYFLKGNPPESSKMYHRVVRTSVLAPPVFKKVTPGDRGSNTYDLDIVVDSDSKIYWVAYEQNTPFTNYIKANPANSYGFQDWHFVKDADEQKSIKDELARPGNIDKLLPSGVLRAPTQEVIKKGTETNQHKLASRGSIEARKDAPTKIKITNLKEHVYYVFYAVAEKSLGGGFSDYAVVESITAHDNTPPQLINISSSMKRKGTDQNKNNIYEGYVTLTFNEPLYYKKDDGKAPQSLNTQDKWNDILKFFRFANTPVHEKGVKVENVTEGDRNTMVQLYINGSIPGDSFAFPYAICDRSGNEAGPLKLYLKETFTKEKVPGTEIPLKIRADWYSDGFNISVKK